MRSLINYVCLLLLFTLHAFGDGDPGFQWAKAGTGKYFDFPYAIAVDSQTNVYITGGIGPSVRFGDQTLRGGNLITNETPFGTFVQPNGVAFLAKYNPSGNLEWVLQDEGSTNSAGRGLAIDSNDHVYLTGEFVGKATFGRQSVANLTENPDIFLAKFSPSGVVTWIRKGGGSSTDWVSGLTIDSEDNIYFTGSTAGAVTFGQLTDNTGLNDFGTARSCMFLTKFTSDGVAEWLKLPGGKGGSTGYALTTRDGKIWVGGGYHGTNVFGRSTIANTNSFQQNGFVATYSSAGDVTSVVTLKGPDGIWVNTLALDQQNNLFVSGPFNGSINLGGVSFKTSGKVYERFVARMNLGGEFAWGQGLGSAVNYNDGNIVGEEAGFTLVSGFTRQFLRDAVSLNSTPPRPGTFGSGDLMVVRFDAAGKAVWGVSGGGNLDDGGAVGARSLDGGLYVAGWFREQATFGTVGITGEVTSEPQTDIFISRMGEVAPVIPKLSVRYIGDGVIRVEWIAPGYTLQEAINLSALNWTATTRTISNLNGVNSVIVPVSSSTPRFFRLVK